MIQTTTLICKLVLNFFFFTSSESSLNTPFKKKNFLALFHFSGFKELCKYKMITLSYSWSVSGVKLTLLEHCWYELEQQIR